MFYDGFEYNSACFNDSKKLIRVMCVIRKNPSSILHLTLHLALPSGATSGTPAYTKTMGDLEVIISVASDG
jgi:hypothetical protein